jgi:hypothetical protein
MHTASAETSHGPATEIGFPLPAGFIVAVFKDVSLLLPFRVWIIRIFLSIWRLLMEDNGIVFTP